jgi:ABC-type phosphate/phosphonate transport system substrate-binding protein
MTLNFLIAPDFSPERFAGWHMFNTLLQRRSGIKLHLLTPASPLEQAALFDKDQVDLVYANPFDAVDLIRQQGYVPFARPAGKSDEMVIATAAESALQRLEDIRPGSRIALTDNKDVRLIGLRLLEPADLTEALIEWVPVDSFQAVARLTLKGDVQAGFFLAEAYASLTRMTRSQLRVLVESRISDISHVVLAHPRMAGDLPRVSQALLGIGSEPADTDVLDALGLPGGFEPISQEDAEFMIDLMDTLLD